MNNILGMGYLLVRINTGYNGDHLGVPLEKEGRLGTYLTDLGVGHDIIKGSSVEGAFDKVTP